MKNRQSDYTDLGFIPGQEIKDSDFIHSFTNETLDDIEDDISNIQKMANLPLEMWKFFIVKENSAISEVWQFIYIFSCIFSSYFYAYLAAFGFH